jgi:lipoic acid synthetase
MILGDICTRGCGFCGVSTGVPERCEADEAERVAAAVREMGLRFAVITSVTRDDLPDGGAGLFASTIKHIRDTAPACRIEVLVPDFQGDEKSLDLVLDETPDVLAHNVETVSRLYPNVRPAARFDRSLELLERAHRGKRGMLTKSGIMVGLGEQRDEIEDTMKKVVDVGTDLFTIGQYLQPSKQSLPIERFYHPDEFEELEQIALSLGFRGVSSGPLVRSSYLAEEQANGELERISRTVSRDPFYPVVE